MAKTTEILVDENKALNYLASPMVKVIVGEGDSAKSFFAHEDLFTSRSCFFKKALKTYGEDSSLQWREGETRTFKLPEDEPAVFRSYVQLLYQGQLPICKNIMDIEAKSSQELQKAVAMVVRQQYVLLSKLYVLCEMLQDSKGKAALISAFVEVPRKLREDEGCHCPTADVIRCVYKGTPERDPLRELIVDFYIFWAPSSWTADTKVEDYPHEFTYEVMKGLIKERQTPEAPARLGDAAYYCKKICHYEDEDDDPESVASL